MVARSHVALLLLTLAACERSAPAPSPPPRDPPRRSLAFRGAPSADAASTEGSYGLVPPDGPSPPVPEVVARCVTRTRATMPPELAGAIGSLDIPSLLEDGCRLDAAPRLRDPSLCEAVASSALRETCGVRAAIAAGTPDRCPSSPGLLGREPVCVAVAARSPALCAAAPGTERGRCLALARADARMCERLEAPFRAACARDAEALAPWLQARRGEALAESAVAVDLVDPTVDGGATVRTWTLRAHRRGAWLDAEGFFWLLDPALGWPRATAAAGEEPMVALKIPTSGVAPGVEVAAEARVLLPDALALDTLDHTARATATFARIPRGRGDLYALTLRLAGARAGAATTLVLRGEGFVRDVAPAATLRPW